MADYVVSDTSLTTVANAIRTKGGTSAQLSFPDGFASAIAALPSGGSIDVEALNVTANGTYTAPTGKAYSPVTVAVSGGGGTAPDPTLPVKFIDYDGTLLYSYTAAELQALTALPANPSHTGLTAQGWNYSLAQAKAQVTAMGEAIIGQNYVTSDDKTRIYCHFEAGRLAPYLGICPNGTVTVDWGDNSATDTLTGTSETSVKTVQHTYASAGDYVITLTAATGTTFAFWGSSNTYSTILRVGTSNSLSQVPSNVYRDSIKKIELGSAAKIGAYAFYDCFSLASITIPSSVADFGAQAFRYCFALTFVTIPSGITVINNYTFNTCYGLMSVSIPSSVTSIGTYVFNYCSRLEFITIPSGVTSIGNYAFDYCYALSSITLPSSVTSVGTYAFRYCYNLTSITILSSATSLGNYAFNYCYNLTSITLPSGMTSIGQGLFQGCVGLASITILSKVTSIGTQAFASCQGMGEYHMIPTTPPTLTNVNTFTSIPSDCIIYVPYSEDHSVLNTYKTESIWTNWATQMQEEPQ